MNISPIDLLVIAFIISAIVLALEDEIAENCKDKKQ